MASESQPVGAVEASDSAPLYGMPIPFMFLGPENERTFQYEETLPSLPIPPLEQTLNKYLDSVVPHLTEEDFENTKKIVEEFSRGIGQDLNHHLLEFAKHKRNWLEKPWEDYAYLMNREPHAPYVNFGGPTPYSLEHWPPKDGTQLERAALVAWFILLFWDILKKEKLAVDRGGKKTVWSMYQFHRMYNGCKTPGETMDTLNDYFKTEREGQSPNHLLVICRGRFFTFSAVDDAGHIITAPEIEEQLRRVRESCDSQPHGPGVGALTAENRTTWYHLRNHLISLDPENEQHLLAIQTSIFAIILDDRTPTSLHELAHEGLVGDPKNRWFDKYMGPVTYKNGMMVSNSDHAPHDAMVNVVVSYFNYIGLQQCGYKWLGRKDIRVLESPKELKFHIDDKIVKAIDDAVALHKKGGDNLDIRATRFTLFGKDAIKKLNLHPDTFVQLALQLGYYRLYKKPAATYETASTRKFYHGRTATLRSCTKESLEWSKAMLNPTASKPQRMKLMLAAFEKHNRLMAEAVEMNDCDRHLMGLQLMAYSQGSTMPALFTDKAYTLSGGGGNYKLSTSCVGYTPVFGGVCPMCKDGYGFFYSIEPHRINIVSCSWVSDKSTSAFKLIDSVMTAMLDMKNLVQSTASAKL